MRAQKCTHRLCRKGLTQLMWVAQTQHVPEKGFKIGFKIGSWLAPGRQILSSWNILSKKSVFVCLRPWITQYQLDQIVNANNLIYGEHLFLLWGLESESCG